MKLDEAVLVVKCKFTNMMSYHCPQCEKTLLHEVAYPKIGTITLCIKCSTALLRSNGIHTPVAVLPL
jgi:DNA-directed RNA polymerase subunit RPC12/RpoP